MRVPYARVRVRIPGASERAGHALPFGRPPRAGHAGRGEAPCGASGGIEQDYPGPGGVASGIGVAAREAVEV